MALTDYTTRLATAIVAAAKIKDEIAYLKLQIKQEKAQTKWAKTSPQVKDLQAMFPGAEVQSDSSMTYISVHLPVSATVNLPFGWELREQRAVNAVTLGSPVVSFYKTPRTPINLYITKAVY